MFNFLYAFYAKTQGICVLKLVHLQGEFKRLNTNKNDKVRCRFAPLHFQKFIDKKNRT